MLIIMLYFLYYYSRHHFSHCHSSYQTANSHSLTIDSDKCKNTNKIFMVASATTNPYLHVQLSCTCASNLPANEASERQSLSIRKELDITRMILRLCFIVSQHWSSVIPPVKSSLTLMYILLTYQVINQQGILMSIPECKISEFPDTVNDSM